MRPVNLLMKSIDYRRTENLLQKKKEKRKKRLSYYNLLKKSASYKEV
jgi:hypothetical protein